VVFPDSSKPRMPNSMPASATILAEVAAAPC